MNSKYKDRLDRLYSKITLARDPYCITCGAPATQAGHYVSRQAMAIRWSEFNLHGQCEYCNCNLGGNLEVYRERLIERYGLPTVEQLETWRHRPHKWTQDELEDFHARGLERLKQLEADR